MTLFINMLLSSIIQMLLFCLIPFVWWGVTARKEESFFRWIGLKGIGKEMRKAAALNTIAIAILFLTVSSFILYVTRDVETAAASYFGGIGIRALPAALVWAVLNTALSEELLFRGFLLKRLSNKFGFTVGNIVQSVIFGLMHGIMFFAVVSVFQAAAVTAFTGLIAFAMGYLNERKSDGSILPSWIVHAVSNTFSATIAMFSLL